MSAIDHEPVGNAEEVPAVEEGHEIDEMEWVQLFNQRKVLDQLYYQMTVTGMEVDGIITRI